MRAPENEAMLGRWFETCDEFLTFECPGCGNTHWIDRPGRRWNRAWKHGRPTVTPSILAKGPPRCHLYITDGMLVFLDDCGHRLAGTSAKMTNTKKGQP